MDALSIIGQLNEARGLPREALAAACERREEMAPLFIAEIQNYLLADPDERIPSDGLFFMFHLLGSWRETSAYQPLAKLLRLPEDEIEEILGDAKTETIHRVIAAVFDGDPQPLYDIILDPDADEFVRSRMFDTLPILVWNEKLDHHAAADFLRDCFLHLQPQAENFVWCGWQGAVAMLGLDELTPLVKQAFDREFIGPMISEFRYYQEDLQRALLSPGFSAWQDDGSCELWGDTVEELSKWAGFSDEKWADFSDEDRYDDEEEDPIVKEAWNEVLRNYLPPEPVYNPYRGVGRNDPCPCGSGKKFKKCCLN
jgi:hypothetical protein